MSIDSSGRVGIGVEPSVFNGNGDNLVLSSSSHTGLTIDATSSTNSSIHFADGADGNEAYRGYLVYEHSSDSMQFGTSSSERMRIESDGKIRVTQGIYRAGASVGSGIAFSTNCMIPLNHTGAADDNTEKLGASGHRWAELHAGNGTIQTSDQRLKQDIELLSDAETSVAVSIKSLIKKFRIKDAVERKGDEARIHVGVIAQDVEQAFVDAGLDPRRYSLFCEDELEDGSKRLGIRYEQLLAFVISAL
jgi:hypothetical protein